ncbi:MAG: long-chain fatty acid--CoA ligase [Anaerolineales bacterium]|nr:long-chain fatty acid--CoA ligase [Anaerolineales bacterium]
MNLSYADKPWIKNYDDGVAPEVEVPDYPLFALLEESAQKYPNNTAIVYQGNRINYYDLNALANDVAAALAASGFKHGDRAVVYMANLPQFIIAYFGILKAGGIVIATNPLYSERELEHQLHDCGAETVFVMTPYYKLLKKVQKKGTTNVKRIIATNVKEYLPWTKRILFSQFKEKKGGHRVDIDSSDMKFQDFIALGKQSPKIQTKVSPEDTALLQYTGGTTGLSKGAIAVHRNLAANTRQLMNWIPDWEYGQEVFISAIPFFHSYGMITAMAFPIAMAAQMVIIPDPRNLADVMGSIQKYKVSYFPGVPAMYVAINNHPDVIAGKYDLTSIRACVSGSAPLLMETKRRFEEITGGKLVEGYGLTEAHVVSHANPLNGDNREGSIGLPISNIECRIVDPVEGEKLLPIGAAGELLLKGPNIMQGYWNMPDETKTALRDGWLFTGDIARMDEDGYFYIEDRKKDLIIAGGYNIYPREVEEVLATHPAVVEVAVAGVTDPKRGETVKAWIVKKPGDTTTEQEIITWSKDYLAKYKYPRVIEFRDELPKSTVGKVLKRELIREEKVKAE